MSTLYHLWLSPGARLVRLLLAEKGEECELVIERTWRRRRDFLLLTPLGEVPVFVDDDGFCVYGAQAICDYIDETRTTSTSFLGNTARERAEVRKVVHWFFAKFYPEVTKTLVEEKILKRLVGHGEPDSRVIRAGLHNLRVHLSYIQWCAAHRRCLAGDSLSMADLAAAAFVSCVEYLGDIEWDAFSEAKAWYVRMKSRPSFHGLLMDRVPGSPPSHDYVRLDF